VVGGGNVVMVTGAALWNVTCAHCKETIYRGEMCVKDGLLKARYYHNECWHRHKEASSHARGEAPKSE